MQGRTATTMHEVTIKGGKKRLTLSWRRPLSYRNQSIDLHSKSMDWFLYDNCLRHERVKLLTSNLVIHRALSDPDLFSKFWNFPK